MYKIGEIVEGTVTGIQNYGAFVSIEDTSGLVHISEISDGFVRKIEDYLQIGKTYTFYVIDIDENNNHLKLSYKKIHDESKSRYINRSTKVLNSNEKYFVDTYKEVNKSLNNLETNFINITYNSNLKGNCNDIIIDELDYVDYSRNLIEKDTLKIKEINSNFDKLVIVSNYDHFDYYDGLIDYLNLSKEKLVYLYNKSSLGSISNIIDNLKNNNFCVLFILNEEYSENEGVIFRLFRKYFEDNNLDSTKYIYICGQEDDSDLIDLINKDNYIFFNETKINPLFSSILPSSLIVYHFLNLDIFKMIQGFRCGLIYHQESKDYLDILNNTEKGRFDIRYNNFYKILKYYEKYINLDICFDYKYDIKTQLPKFKDYLKKLKSKEGKFIVDMPSNCTTNIKLKINNEYSFTYLISLLYLIISAKKELI